MPTDTERSTREEADRLYERYVRPLEPEHTGEFVVVTPTGKIALARTLVESAEKAQAVVGPDNFLYKVGQRTVGWRRLS